MTSSLKNIFFLLRVKQWVKNFFILFPLIFAGNLYDPEAFALSCVALMGFCFISSSGYIFNDLLDYQKDRLHPHKSSRPLSTGAVSRSFAVVFALLLLFFGLSICRLVNQSVLLVAVLYILLHIAYNLVIKNTVILDVIFIALGFQIRIWAGSLAISILPSVWLQMCVFVLALFLGFTKRRYEMSFLKDSAKEHRLVLSHYTSYLLDQMIIICSTLAIVFYGLYTISNDVVSKLGHYNMVYSVAFVIYGIFRYLYLIHVRKKGRDPVEIFLSDGPLFFNICLWVVFIIFMIYR